MYILYYFIINIKNMDVNLKSENGLILCYENKIILMN